MIPRVLPLIALAALAIGAWFLHSSPTQTVENSLGCAIHRLTGLHCPGCGSTRAAAQLSQGQVLSALSSNALVFVTVPLMIYLLVASVLRQWTRWKLPQPRLRKTLWIGLIAVVVLFTILRNLPPFEFLAP